MAAVTPANTMLPRWGIFTQAAQQHKRSSTAAAAAAAAMTHQK
jgi:hypothetical protein